MIEFFNRIFSQKMILQFSLWGYAPCAAMPPHSTLDPVGGLLSPRPTRLCPQPLYHADANDAFKRGPWVKPFALLLLGSLWSLAVVGMRGGWLALR